MSQEIAQTLGERLRGVFDGCAAHISERDGVVRVEVEVAERRAFLSRRKLVYAARYRIDERGRELRFSEMLKETGFGLSTGSDEPAPGIGFKREIWKTDAGGRSGLLEEQSRHFGKQYSYAVAFEAFRQAAEKLAADAGYAFVYRINPHDV